MISSHREIYSMDNYNQSFDKHQVAQFFTS